MKNRSGRRARKKTRKKREEGGNVTLSHETAFTDLRRWLKRNGFRSKALIPACFTGTLSLSAEVCDYSSDGNCNLVVYVFGPDTGRGLMATQHIKADELVISLPEKCLLTTSSVLKSYMGEYIKRWKPPVSPLVALCSFLIAERHYGDSAKWSPYIKVLPKSYTCPVYFSNDIMDLLPRDVRKKAVAQKEQFEELYSSSLPFFLSLQPIFTQPVEVVFTQDAVRWAWCSVNTRTVYMVHAQSDFLSREKDVFALAPYLDLLNHCPEVQVHAGFNELSRCYEIRSVHGCKKFQQAFICYGPHDNQRLLLEYGFVASGNQHSVVYVDLGTLKLCLNEADRQLQQKLLFLKDNDFLRNLTFGVDGPSWRLMTALRLLSLKPEQYSCWKSILLGAPVSEDREDWCTLKAQTLCQQLCDDNVNALTRIAQLKGGAEGARLEQLRLVESLRREERAILERSKQVLQNIVPQSSPWQPNKIQNMEH